MKRIALAAALLLAAAAVAGVARPEGAHAVDGQAASRATRSPSTGNGSVTAVPTTAVFSFGVDTRAATAKAALAGNAREMRQVIAAVKAAGGRERRHAVGLALAGLRTRTASRPGSRPRTSSPRRSTSIAAGAADRRRRRRRREPGQRPLDVGRRPGQALPPGAEGRGRRCPAERRDARRRRGPLARQGDVRRRERRRRPPVPMFEKAAASDAGTPIEAGTQEIDGERDGHLRARLVASEPPAAEHRRPVEPAAEVRSGRRSVRRPLTRRRVAGAAAAPRSPRGGGTTSSSAC